MLERALDRDPTSTEFSARRHRQPSDLVFYVSLTVFFLFLCARVLDSARWRSWTEAGAAVIYASHCRDSHDRVARDRGRRRQPCWRWRCSCTARAWKSARVAGAGDDRGALLVAATLCRAHGSRVRSTARRRAARNRRRSGHPLYDHAILVVVQATSVNRSRTFDLTRNHRHTLAPQTTALLDSLDRDLTVTGFFRKHRPKRAGAEELLSLYGRRSPRFTLRAGRSRPPARLARRLEPQLTKWWYRRATSGAWFAPSID